MVKIDDLSIQLYSLRNYGTLEQQASSLAEIGFKAVETIGSHLGNAQETRACLDRYGLTAPTGHVNLDDLRSRLSWVSDQAHLLGIEDLYMPAVPTEERKGDADYWHRLGAELGAIAEQMNEAGIGLGYHNHDWEFVELPDGTMPIEHLFKGADGSPLSFEADLAWIARSGSDPVTWMDRFQSRLRAIHVKDLAPVGENRDEDGWADIGQGTLNWSMLWRHAKDRGARWMVLEHDKPSDALRFARASRDYLRSMQD